MEKVKRASLTLMTFGSYLFMPLLSFAQGSIGDEGGPGPIGGEGGPGPSQSGGLENPLGDTTIIGFLQDILDVIMIFAVPLIVFMIIYAGFIYVMARGNEGDVSKAHRALLYAVIGGVIILGANVILAVIQGTVDAFRT